MNERELDLVLLSLHLERMAVPDVDAVVRYVLDAPIEQTRQRRVSPAPFTWRSETMFSATKFVVAGVVVALFGGLVLAGVITQPSGETAPGVVASATSEVATTAQPSVVVVGADEADTDAVTTLDTADVPSSISRWESESVAHGVWRLDRDPTGRALSRWNLDFSRDGRIFGLRDLGKDGRHRPRVVEIGLPGFVSLPDRWRSELIGIFANRDGTLRLTCECDLGARVLRLLRAEWVDVPSRGVWDDFGYGLDRTTWRWTYDAETRRGSIGRHRPGQGWRWEDIAEPALEVVAVAGASPATAWAVALDHAAGEPLQRPGWLLRRDGGTWRRAHRILPSARNSLSGVLRATQDGGALVNWPKVSQEGRVILHVTDDSFRSIDVPAGAENTVIEAGGSIWWTENDERSDDSYQVARYKDDRVTRFEIPAGSPRFRDDARVVSVHGDGSVWTAVPIHRGRLPDDVRYHLHVLDPGAAVPISTEPLEARSGPLGTTQ